MLPIPINPTFIAIPPKRSLALSAAWKSVLIKMKLFQTQQCCLVVKLSEVLLLLPYAQRHGHDDPEMHKVQQKINHPGIKRDCHGIILLERRCKIMNKPSRTANSRHQLLFFGVTLLGIILLASALWQPASIEPPGWVAVNNQVEQVLTGQERATGVTCCSRWKDE